MKKIIVTALFIGVFASQVLMVSAGYFNTSPASNCEAHITRTLQIGAENSEVYTLQRILVQQGFLDVAPNGYFGRQTKYAVQAFQLHNGIHSTGVVGYQTREALNEGACSGEITSSFMNSPYSFNPEYSPSGVTQVSQNDPFVTVINPPVAAPVIYNTPQATSYTPSYVDNTSYGSYDRGPLVTPTVVQMGSSYNPSQISSAHVIYSPSIGYTYGITPASGSVTVSSPTANAVYNQGDTVLVTWGTSNLRASTFSILLESNISGQSKVVGVTGGTSFSFILTKEILDAVCSGTCNNVQQGSFRVVLTTPTTDIAGITSTLRAAVAPITIKRPLANQEVSISASKTPVNTGEVFKLYVNVPTNSYGYTTTQGVYGVRLKAICPPSVTASIAGVMCGQEFVIPSTVISAQQEIPAVITNGTWYKQDVVFQVVIVNLANQVIGSAETRVTANGAPFSF